MALVHATLTDVSHAAGTPGATVVSVRFNPTDLSLDRGSHYASMPVPGLSMPVLQYIRGESDTLQLELFLDNTDLGKDIEDDLAQMQKFVTIRGDLHAPPVVEFAWGNFAFR